MLNISNNSITAEIPENKYKSLKKLDLPGIHKGFRRWFLVVILIISVMLFLPWTQNIQSKGKVTALDPSQRPQTIHATIAGRIEAWHVQEGDLVSKGDTIVFLSEIKEDYFDPQLVNRANLQVQAKTSSVNAYDAKINALEQQIAAMRNELILKQDQLTNKIRQGELKKLSLEAALSQARIDLDIADYQYRRTDTLYAKGIKSLTDLEGKKLKQQETAAKLVKAENEALEIDNEIAINKLELRNVVNEYQSKIAKAESDKFSSLSERLQAEGDIQKLQTQAQNYQLRSGFYYITAPQDCYITKALTPGIGETVKNGEAIVSIMPANANLAVELYIQPMDLPLIQIGQPVNFIFDGWPAFVFSGWPNLSLGTFQGTVAAIDNNANEDGFYRILVRSDETEKPWPDALRVGSGAQGVAFINDVPLWYELWRQLNGFPPDFYQETPGVKSFKTKAPVKSVAK